MNDRADRARLHGVTLVAVTSVALDATVAALEASVRECRFERVLLLSDERPAAAGPLIDWCRIDRLCSRADYSRFMLQSLADYIGTPHALCVQWDGFVLNGGGWDPRFLDYDYIGAVWPHFRDHHNVGNGGFSLRSKRLLELCKQIPFDGREGEDVLVGRSQRRNLEEQGVRFAPEEVARKFSYERTRPRGDEFGFHGIFNLVRHRPAVEVLHLLNSLEPQMLAPSEQRELLRWALSRGHAGIARTLMSRMAARRKQI